MPMTRDRRRHVRERLRRLFKERDVTRMSVSAIWALVIEEAVFSSEELDEIYAEAHDRLVARILLRNPALRRQVEEVGLDDPLVRSQIQELIDRDREDLGGDDEREDR